MNTRKFKTNIKCTGCLSAVTPNLNNLAGENNWNVDLNNPQKILTVNGDPSEAEIIEAVKRAGFEAEKV
ncbi:MAG: heavy metal-associated domain-containing protein [Bacteroidota bacterium]